MEDRWQSRDVFLFLFPSDKERTRLYKYEQSSGGRLQMGQSRLKAWIDRRDK